jgi:hypothetical protein
MKRGLELQLCGLEQVLMVTVLIIVGLLPTVRSVWGQDETDRPSPPPSSTKTAPAADTDVRFDIDQLQARLVFLSVPTELVESTISDWTLTPFDQEQLAAVDPFGTMNQPLQLPKRKLGELSGQVTAGTAIQLPSIHKILNDQEAKLLSKILREDERTHVVLKPQLVFIDGITASLVVGEQTPFIVGWKNDAPQTRVVPKGKMVRIRTVLDDDKIWLDYEIIVSRILDVTTRSIRVANRLHPIKLSVPHVQTTKASATIEMPVGGTLLIGGLPTESPDGIPRQLLVMLWADRIGGLQTRKTAKSEPARLQGKVVPDSTNSAQAKPAIKRRAEPEEKRSRFSLISRSFDRSKKQPADAVDAPDRRESQ